MTKSTKGDLLYRASRDGFTGQAFHSKCDGKGNTISIIKNNSNLCLVVLHPLLGKVLTITI